MMQRKQHSMVQKTCLPPTNPCSMFSEDNFLSDPQHQVNTLLCASEPNLNHTQTPNLFHAPCFTEDSPPRSYPTNVFDTPLSTHERPELSIFDTPDTHRVSITPSFLSFEHMTPMSSESQREPVHQQHFFPPGIIDDQECTSNPFYVPDVREAPLTLQEPDSYHLHTLNHESSGLGPGYDPAQNSHAVSTTTLPQPPVFREFEFEFKPNLQDLPQREPCPGPPTKVSRANSFSTTITPPSSRRLRKAKSFASESLSSMAGPAFTLEDCSNEFHVKDGTICFLDETANLSMQLGKSHVFKGKTQPKSRKSSPAGSIKSVASSRSLKVLRDMESGLVLFRLQPKDEYDDHD